MALEGTIKEFGLADIFQLIGLQNKTGVLFLKSESETVNVHFEDGQVVKVEESKRRPHLLLGQILVRKGRVTNPQVKVALESQKNTGQKIGNALLSQGLINKDELRGALTFQMNEAIYSVFRWKGGDYKFDQERVDFDRDTILPISTEHILMDGVRQLDEWPQIEQNMPDLAVVFKRRDGLVLPSEVREEDRDKDIFSTQGDANINPESEAVLKMVNGQNTVLEVVEMSSLGEFDTSRVLVELIDRGLIQQVSAVPDEVIEEITKPSKQAKEEVVKPKISMSGFSISGSPFINKTVSYAVVVFTILTLFFQLTGTKKIMDVSQTGIEPLKEAFAVNLVKNNEHASYVYLFDKMKYPETPRNLELDGYISESDQQDPWGNPIPLKYSKEGNLYSVSAGPDKAIGTADDIRSDHDTNM